MKLLRIFLTGMFISFLGTLPLGTLNISAMQIAVSDGIRPALLFALGALLVEIIYVRISLVAMNWVTKRKKLLRRLGWITVIIITALAISSFIAAGDPSVKKNVILSNTIHRFWLGVGLSAINPLQIPFWFGWSTALFSKGVLRPIPSHYNFYIMGIGLGTFLGNLVFIFGGRFVVEALNTKQSYLQFIIGSIFLLTAVLLFIKLIRKKDAFSTIPENNLS